MTGKLERAEGRAEGSSQVRPLGEWPTINLNLMEEEDFKHTGSKASGEADSASSGERSGAVRTGPSYVLRIHTDIPLKNPAIYNAVRNALRPGNSQARQATYALLEREHLLDTGTPTARAMVAAALDVL